MFNKRKIIIWWAKKFNKEYRNPKWRSIMRALRQNGIKLQKNHEKLKRQLREIDHG